METDTFFSDESDKWSQHKYDEHNNKENPTPGGLAKWRMFDMVKWICVHRLQWLVHILRTDPGRKLKQTIFEVFKQRRGGDMLMDTPKSNSWRLLNVYLCDG